LTEDWRPCLVTLGAAGALYWALSKTRDRAPAPPIALRVAPFAVLAIGVIQLLPLPVGWVRLLSPARAEIHEAARAVLGGGGTATLSLAPAETLQSLLTLAGCVVVFFLVRDLAWRLREHQWALALPFVLVAFLEGVLGLVQSYGAGLPQATGTYVNRNHFSGLLEMSLPFAVMYAVTLMRRQSGRRSHRTPARPAILACVWLSAATVMLAAVIHSLSRMGFLAALASFFVMGAASLSGEGPGARRWWPVALAGALVLTGFIFLPTDQLIERFADMAQTDEITADQRAEVWRDTGNLIQAYPLAGTGLGTYEAGLYRYKSVAPMNTVDRAHNDYLQGLAEFGAVGFALLLALALRTYGRALRASASPVGTDERYLGIACVGSLTAIVLHSLVDFNLYIPANAMLVAWVAGIAEGLEFPSLRWPRSRSRRSTYLDAKGAPARG